MNAYYRQPAKVPTLDPNGEANWIFDVATKKTIVAKIFTVMTGSVVTSGKKKSDSKKRVGDVGKENMGANKRSRAGAAKAKAKAKNTTSVAVPNIPDEEDVTSATVTCSVGVRNKLWADDLLKCASHVSMNLIQSIGIGDADVMNELKMHLVETGLLFAFKDQIMLETLRGPRLFRKWSMVRPALKEHGQVYLVKAGQWNQHYITMISSGHVTMKLPTLYI